MRITKTPHNVWAPVLVVAPQASVTAWRAAAAQAGQTLTRWMAEQLDAASLKPSPAGSADPGQNVQ